MSALGVRGFAIELRQSARGPLTLQFLMPRSDPRPGGSPASATA